MLNLTAREKEMLHLLFSPNSINKLIEWFPETTSAEWELLYSKLLNHRSKTNKMILYVDGAYNPGNNIAGIGGILYLVEKNGNEGEELFTFSENIGKATNNIAEYSALIRGLQYAKQLNSNHITIFSDSELMVKQLKLDYKVKSDHLLRLFNKANDLLSEFKTWTISHIPREKNRKADILSSNALKLEKKE